MEVKPVEDLPKSYDYLAGGELIFALGDIYNIVDISTDPILQACDAAKECFLQDVSCKTNTVFPELAYDAA